MADYIGWALLAAINPTLLAAVTAMIMLPHPRRLMFGYLCGALLTSISLGLVIVFQLKGTGQTIDTTKHTVAPAFDIVLGLLLLVVAYAIHTGRDHWRRERAARRRAARAQKGPPRWRRALDRGSARITFVVGVCLTLPGLSYLIGMSGIAKQDYSNAGVVVAVVAFCVVMLMLIEIPLIGALIAPEWSDRAIERFSALLRANAGRIAYWAAIVLGALLVGRGVLTATGIIG